MGTVRRKDGWIDRETEERQTETNELTNGQTDIQKDRQTEKYSQCNLKLALTKQRVVGVYLLSLHLLFANLKIQVKSSGVKLSEVRRSKIFFPSL